MKTMIDNSSSYKLEDIYEYFAGYTTKLHKKITIRTIFGAYYNTVIIKDTVNVNV